MKTQTLLPLLLLLALPAVVQAQFTFTTNDGAISITGYTGSGGAVTIPSSTNGYPVTSIGDNAFAYCTMLTSVRIPNSISSIGTNAFYSCWELTNLTIPNSVSSIGLAAFDFSGVASVIIPNSVTNIGDDAFFNCFNLTNVTIGSSVTNIGDDAFNGCNSLTAITVDGFNSSYSSVDGVLFDKSQTTLIQYPGGKWGSYTIPNSVTSIGDSACSWCKLTSVTIPDSVTNIGEAAFLDCSRLTTVSFQGNAPSCCPDAFVYQWGIFTGFLAATVYYLPGTSGWGSTFGGLPTALWLLPNPLILTGPSFGIQNNGFGFIISWATNIPVVVEAGTNLASPVWYPVATNTLTSGSAYFSDPQWTNYPARFYRLRSP